MQTLPDFDKNLRRKTVLIKYTMLVFLAYAITQVATLGAYMWGLSSVQPVEILLVTSVTLGSTLLFGITVKLKKTITTRFANLVFFGQFAVWLVMYTIWILTLREVRGMALFCALMALSFLLANAKLIQSILITAAAAIIQIAGSYFAIFYLNQPGTFGLEVFYTLCYLPSALFICNISHQYARQRSEVRKAKDMAEKNWDALGVETKKAHRLNAELQEAIITIREISIRDVLTGLYNRRHLMDMLEAEKKRADRAGRLFAVAILDIDHFKRINDSYGHPNGDIVLQAVAKLIQETLRGSDFCARFGGEEFVMVLQQTSEHGALACAQRVLRLIESAQFPAFENQLQVTASLGVSWYQPKEDISQTISRADAALYRAKQGGRNRIEHDNSSAAVALAHLSNSTKQQ